MDERRGMMEDGREARDDGRGTMDEKRTNKIRTVRDLKVYREAIRNGEESRYLLSSLLLATYRAVARRAKTEAVIFRPSS